MDKKSFLESLKSLKEEYDIRPISHHIVTNKMIRRLTILVTDEFLRADGDIHQAFFFEACLYFHLKKESLNCDELPIESQEAEKYAKARKGFNPLKLVSERYQWEEDSPCFTALVKQVISELKREKVITYEFRRYHTGKRLVRGPQYKQKHTQKSKTARATLLQPK